MKQPLARNSCTPAITGQPDQYVAGSGQLVGVLEFAVGARSENLPASGKEEPMPNTCYFVECDETIRSDHYLCRPHWDQEQDGEIDECGNCDQFKSSEYELCLTCKRELSRSKRKAGKSPRKTKVGESKPEYVLDAPDPRPRKDEDTDVFYVYILALNDGKYYAGQTNDIKSRILEHNRGKTKATIGKNPKLVWFSRVRTRPEAEAYEKDLKKLCRDENDRVVSRTMVVPFLEIVDLVQDPRKSAT